MNPIIKWVGGKRQLLPELVKYINAGELENGRYFEPFVGGGAMLFTLEPEKATINDLNKELVTMYKVIRTSPVELIEKLKEHAKNHSKDYYYRIRGLDRLESFSTLSDVDVAARMIYLNRTCFNGLYRVNSKGFFNSPIGRNAGVPNIVMEDRIQEIHAYFQNNDVTIMQGDYKTAVSETKAGDLVYFDPPYDYDVEGAGFTTYTSIGFDRNNLKELCALCNALKEKGVKVVVSNNDTDFVNDLFKGWDIEHVTATRMINCDSTARQNAREVIIHS